MIWRWGDYLFLTTLLLLIAGTAIGVWLAIAADQRAYGRFMADCGKSRAEYECTAMWRSGSNNTTVVPVPVVVSR